MKNLGSWWGAGKGPGGYMGDGLTQETQRNTVPAKRGKSFFRKSRKTAKKIKKGRDRGGKLNKSKTGPTKGGV